MPRKPGPLRGRGAADNPKNRFYARSVTPNPEAFDPEEPLPRTQFIRDTSRSILATNDTPDIPFEASINPYRGCEHGCVYCLSGDTRILMSDGNTRPLSELQPGDWIAGTVRAGWYRKYVKTQVLAHWKTRKSAYRIALEDGTELVASGDHQFLAEEGWKFVTRQGNRPELIPGNRLMGIVQVRGTASESSTRGSMTTSPVTIALPPLYGHRVVTSDSLRIRCVEPLSRTEELFDITTGTGDFIANGVVSHNCYARPFHEFLGFSAGLDFETKILVKEDAPELLRKELSAKKWKPKLVAISGVTDPYQPVERRLQLTRRCLEVLAEFKNPVAIITKNHLVTRDSDLLGSLAKHNAAAVFVSITTLDPALASKMEPRTSTPARRLDALRRLADAGVPVGVNVAPIIPGLTDHEVPAILQAAAKAGARFAGHIVLRLPHGVKDLFEKWLGDHFPDRKEKVLHRVREVRGGRLYDPLFGARMSGTGEYADQIHQLFRLGCRKAGLTDDAPELSTASFKVPPGPQLELF